MSKRLDKFTRSFQHSQIPFVLAEVLTDGTGKMVDLVCRFANAPATALLDAGGGGDDDQAVAAALWEEETEE